MTEETKKGFNPSEFNMVKQLDDPNTLIIHMQSKKTGSRLLSKIEMNAPESVFDYDIIIHDTRGDGSVHKIPTFMKVITSNRITHRTEVSLCEDEKKIIVKMRREEYERSPRIALIRTDISPAVIERVQTKDPVFMENEELFEYTFENVEQGSYYLFIEPLFLF